MSIKALELPSAMVGGTTLSVWRDRERPTDRAPGEKALPTQRRVVRLQPALKLD